MRVVFFGSPEAAVPVLRTILASRHQVLAVVTQPDRPSGRGLKLTAPAAKAAALESNLPVFQPHKAREADFVERMRELQPQAFVVVAYGQILPQLLLDVPERGSFNVHFSLLPRYRGAAPVQWALLGGESRTGVTIMRMDAGLDTGPILFREDAAIEPSDDALSLESRLAGIGAELMVRALDRIEAGAVTESPQDPALATYAPMIKKELGRIDWEMEAGLIDRRRRALVRWPGVHFDFRGSQVRLLQTLLLATEPTGTPAEPGTVVRLDEHGLWVACGEQTRLCLQRLQPAGRGTMSARDFANGHRLALGDRLR